MNPGRWLYRAKQFFAAYARPTPADLALVRQTLTPAQAALFAQLQPSEQTHAVRVLREVRVKCKEQGWEAPPDLEVAALLHDVGKARFPMWIWERVMIVLGKAILPEAVTRWATSPPRGWKRPFVIAAHHPAWGAEMASERGTSPRAVALILQHQDLDQQDDPLLAILQAVDDES
jgi:hypothetical protein